MDEQKEVEIKESAVTKSTTRKRSSLLSFLVELPFLILGAFIIAWLVKSFVVQPFKIEQQSMLPTLYPADRVFVSKFIYRFQEPERGDIVTFRPPNQTRILIKRIVATEGEVVQIRRGRVFVDGKPLNEKYLNSSPDYSDYGPKRVPAEAVFVLGDNRPNSGDSRLFGSFPEESLLGKAFLVYWPPERWKAIR